MKKFKFVLSIFGVIFLAILIGILFIGTVFYIEKGYKNEYSYCKRINKNTEITKLNYLFKYHSKFGCWLGKKL